MNPEDRLNHQEGLYKYNAINETAPPLGVAPPCPYECNWIKLSDTAETVWETLGPFPEVIRRVAVAGGYGTPVRFLRVSP